MIEKLTPKQAIAHVRWSDDAQPFERLVDTGLLYWINRNAFHPFGFSLALDVNEETGEAEGFKLLGDGAAGITFDRGDPALEQQIAACNLTMLPKMRDDGQAL